MLVGAFLHQKLASGPEHCALPHHSTDIPDNMDKLIEGISKIFSHLSRDIQTYIFAGLIVLANLYIIDETYYSGDTSYKILHSDYSVLILIIASYIIGQICLGFYTLILEFWRFDKILYKYFFKKRYDKLFKEKKMETYKFGGRFVDNDNKKTIYIYATNLFYFTYDNGSKNCMCCK